MIGMLPEVVSSKCVTAVLQKTHHRAPLLCFSCVYVLNSSFFCNLLASESHVMNGKFDVVR